MGERRNKWSTTTRGESRLLASLCMALYVVISLTSPLQSWGLTAEGTTTGQDAFPPGVLPAPPCHTVTRTSEENAEYAANIVKMIRDANCAIPSKEMLEAIARAIDGELTKTGFSQKCSPDVEKKIKEIVQGYLKDNLPRLGKLCGRRGTAVSACIRKGVVVINVGTACYQVVNGQLKEAVCTTIDSCLPIPVCEITTFACDKVNDATQYEWEALQAQKYLEERLNTICRDRQQKIVCEQISWMRTCEDIALVIAEAINGHPNIKDVDEAIFMYCQDTCNRTSPTQVGVCINRCINGVRECLKDIVTSRLK